MRIRRCPERYQVRGLFQRRHVYDFRSRQTATSDQLKPEHGIHALRIADGADIISGALDALEEAPVLQFSKRFSERPDGGPQLRRHIALRRQFLSVDQASRSNLSHQEFYNLKMDGKAAPRWPHRSPAL